MLVADSKDGFDGALGLEVSLGRGDMFVEVVDPVGGRFCFELLDEVEDPTEQIDRFESGDCDRQIELVGKAVVGMIPGDGADVSCGQEAIDTVVDIGEDRVECGGYEYMADQSAEGVELQFFRLVDCHRRRWGGRFKTDSKQNDLAIRGPGACVLGFGTCDSQRVER